MNNNQMSTLSCFASTKIESKRSIGSNLNGVHHVKQPISKSLHDNINYLESSSLNSSHSSGQNVLTLRPKPPPYDEYTAKKYAITRSHSTYSARHDSLRNDNGIDKVETAYLQDDLISQYSDGDPPRLTDHLPKSSISRHCVRPVTLRPTSPPNKRCLRHATSFPKTTTDSQQSPSGDSGVRLTPNDSDQLGRTREMELHNYLHNSSDLDRMEELKILKLVNNKMSVNELNNQQLITKATHLIGKLRQKLKDKDSEINVIQMKLKDNTERLRSKEKICKELEIEFQKSCIGSKEHSSIIPKMEASTQTTLFSERDNVDLETLSQRFENERAQWLEEKALVIGYHKQLNDKYHSLLEKNTHLENELLRLQGRYISDADSSSDSCGDSDVDQKSKPQSTKNNAPNAPVSRLVKFEESLC